MKTLLDTWYAQSGQVGPVRIPNLDRYQETYLCLPLHQGLTENDARWVTGLIREFYR